MTTPIGCTLYVDGARVADGSPGDDPAVPTALTALTVTWGRNTTIDQPEPSTCSFHVMDPPGGASFLNLLYTGARVDVVATADVPAPPDVPANIGGDFEDKPVGYAPTSIFGGTGTPTVVAVGAANSTRGVLAPITRATNVYVTAPPAPMDWNPAAWDHLPTTALGDAWTGGVTLAAAPYTRVLVQLAAFTAPFDVAPVLVGAPTAVTTPSAPAWLTVTAGLAEAARAGLWLGVSVRIAKVPTWNDWAPAGVAWQDANPWWTWAELAALRFDDVTVLAPSGAAIARESAVFSGRVTDLQAGWDFDLATVVCAVTAADFTADLAQRDVGDVPWPAETVAARFAHIVAASGVTIPYSIAPTLASWLVSWRDVDRQQAMPLLQDLATSVDGVLWSATHRLTGPRLQLSDPRVGAALYRLEMGDDGLVHVVATDALGAAIELDACDVLLDPVVWKQAVSDVSTRVTIGWREQTLDDGGLPAPTDHTDVYADAALEVQLGTRNASVSTELTTAADAAAVAALILGRLRLQSWRVGGLLWVTDPGMDADHTVRVLDLLDGTRRLAAPILLTNLPAWAPSGGATLPLILQGGDYTFDGGWGLNLTTSSAAAQGTSLPWNAVDPAWAWNQFDPDVAWPDLVGVAA